MPRPKASGPTERELELLQVLWGRGPSTTKELHEALSKTRDTAYNSVLTILSIMLEKGYVGRDESQKSHVYHAKHSKSHVEATLVRSFMDGVFGGSAMRLVTKALELRGASQEEREKIRQLLQEMEDGRERAD